MKSNTKRRKVVRSSVRGRHQETAPSPTTATGADTVLPSCEADEDAATFSFSAGASSTSSTSFSANPREPTSSQPPRLQTHTSFVSTADNASSTASSPCCAAALAEVSIDSDRGGEASGTESGTAPPPRPTPTRSRSPIKYPHRSIMSGDGDFQRSSSPLKRRASSMDPEPNEDDVDMVAPAHQPNGIASSSADLPRADLPRAMSVDPDGGPGYRENADAIPPVAEQLKMIKTLQAAFNEKPVAENDKAFVVSKSWVRRGLELGSDPKLARKEMPDDGLGPVDNSDIILQVLVDRDGKPFVRLNPGTDLEICELFCEDAWDLIHKWYGLKDGQYPIERKAVNTQADPRCPANIEYELNPPVFRIHRLWSLHSGIEIPEEGRNLLPLLMVRSRGESFHQFLKDIKKTLRINLAIEIRLWEVVRALPATSSATAHNPQDSWQKLLLEVTAWSEFDYNRRVKIEAPDSTRNPKYNGKSRLSTFNLATDKTLVVEEAVGDDGWVSTKSSLASRPNNRAPRPSNIATTSRTNSGRASPALSGPVTRGRAKKKKGGRGTGAVGLGNLGNTCYMNSALQCVRSVEELTKYFLTGEYAEEINEQNHLGYGGKMAIAYGHLLADMYNTSNDSVRPSNFKSTAGSIRPAFASWGQQDSQEFLGFLLDALQEDLSRVKKKPYIEKPDSTDDMVHDEAAIAKMADEVWDITMKRDDSVISDLFTGLYKSTLKCPACHKISITFDPFNNLTLPLPIENPWAKAVKFYPLNDCPVEIEVEIPQHSGVDVLKRFISDRTGVPVERLIGAEEFKCKFFKMYDDTTDVSDEIQNTDIPTVHELEVQPSNWPPKPVARAKQHQKVRSMLEFETPESDEDPFDDARYDHMVVPVLHRRDNKQTRISYLHKDNGLPPHFIVLNREEARSEDAIRRKVLERVATFTTWDGFQGDDGDTAENTDAEMTLASDADSGDSKVVAKSVEGEDDMVDVSMNGVAKDPPAMAPKNPPPIRVFNKRRPRWVNTSEFLDPRVQNMFDLGYFADAKSSDQEVSTGWTTIEDHKVFPRLSDRVPDPITPSDQDSPGQGSWQNGNGSDDDSGSDDIPNVNAAQQTRMAEESDEDDDVNPHKHKGRGNGSRAKHKQKVGAVAAPTTTAAGGGRGRQNRNRKTYGKKDRQRVKGRRGNKHAHAQNHQSFQAVNIAPQDRLAGTMPDEYPGPLVRLGEGIVVDWTESAWDLLFGLDSTDDPSRGAKTYMDLSKLRDPVLEQKRKQRISRRTTGISLDDCLDEFERAEILSEHDMWYCPRCKEHRRASKKFDLWKTPDILVCHLKRFSSSHYRRDKIDVKVNFPVEGLDLEQRVLKKEDGKVEVYDLIGVDEHFGGLGGGHYTASAKNFIDGTWYRYNDSIVDVVKNPGAEVVSAAAYLLFYRRRSQRPLGGARFESIFKAYAQRDSDTEMGGGSADEQEAGGSSLHVSVGMTTRGTAGTSLVQMADEEPPPYGQVRTSIEEDDEGIGMSHPNQSPFKQQWTFASIDATVGDKGKGKLVDYNSDSAQQDSSSERAETESMAPGGGSTYSVPDSCLADEPSKDPPGYYGEPNEPRNMALEAMTTGEESVPWAGIGGIGASSFGDDDQDDPTVEIHIDDNSKDAGKDQG